uniref:Uncharacterized protein n=1 Tax=Candidatus Kentrum sp. TC TaxID=2126339 RepID=A0A450YE63_9GAMM|nr:MAG: hypothetical protein BECKTC1821E_GA0114239_100572 [Candidatus Kentron sp. TC]VFK54187.1 MAG: hypothetical protein BECKTC1821F_GA0114240_100453 [Candidatus Kentron sp. TC]
MVFQRWVKRKQQRGIAEGSATDYLEAVLGAHRAFPEKRRGEPVAVDTHGLTGPIPLTAFTLLSIGVSFCDASASLLRLRCNPRRERAEMRPAPTHNPHTAA